MHPTAIRPSAAFLVAAVCLVGPICPARADHVEHRDFEIRVDDKPAGKSRLTMTVKDDGTTHVEASAKVEVKIGPITAHSYHVGASETWTKDGHLIELKCSSVENKVKTEVEVTRSGKDLQVKINGGNGSVTRGDVWTTSFWKLADKRFHNNPVPVFDVDSGKTYNGQLQYMGTEKIKVGNDLPDCYHFRVTGIPNTTEVWFDQYHRLVRQEFIESGHKTIVQLLPGAR